MSVLREKINDDIVSIIFESKNKEIIDIDQIFKDTNRNFAKLLDELGLKVDFDFKKSDNKKLYTHEFIKTFMEYIKNRSRTEKILIYSNMLSKDDFRNRLVKKLKTIFGFNLMESYEDMNIFYENIEKQDCLTMTSLDIFLNETRKCKSFKSIKKYFEKNGLTYLNDTYFKDFTNKLCLFI
jgi:hypothetical protein